MKPQEGEASRIGGAKPCSKEHAHTPYKLQNDMSLFTAANRYCIQHSTVKSVGVPPREEGVDWEDEGGGAGRWTVLLQLRKGQREAVLAVTTKCCTKIDK